MVKFVIAGHTVDPNTFEDALTRVVLEGIRTEIQEKVGTIRDPNTGEFPTVVVSGDSLDDLKLHVEGSAEIIELVRKRLDIGPENDQELAVNAKQVPRVFLSYTSDDVELARRLAESLQANGIETWWDRWCIGPGDSLRQKIDEGLSDCTDFVVLLTPQSINKPWVNQEMDAALVLKLSNRCNFLPIRFKLPPSALPPLLSGMHSPEITTTDDIAQLISDIHGISRKPPRCAASRYRPD